MIDELMNKVRKFFGKDEIKPLSYADIAIDSMLQNLINSGFQNNLIKQIEEGKTNAEIARILVEQEIDRNREIWAIEIETDRNRMIEAIEREIQKNKTVGVLKEHLEKEKLKEEVNTTTIKITEDEIDINENFNFNFTEIDCDKEIADLRKITGYT